MAKLRRVAVALGAAMIVGGWGATQFAKEWVHAIDVHNQHLVPKDSFDPLDHFAAGVVLMALGALLVVLTAPWESFRSGR